MLLETISPMLPKEDSKNVVVKKSYRRLNGKSKWWFTIIAPPSTLSIIEAAWPTLQAESRWTLQCSLRKHHPLPSHLPSPSHAASPNPPPPPPTTPSLPDSDIYPVHPHASSSPTNTHSPSSHPHAESPPPPPPLSNSAPSVPSDPFLEGIPTLLGGPPPGPVSQE